MKQSKPFSYGRALPATLPYCLALLAVFALLFLRLHPQPLYAATPDAGDQAQRLYLPLMGNRASFCSYDSKPQPFGVQMYNASGRGYPFFNKLLSSHADWVRVTINWDSVEPANVAPSAYRWGAADVAIAAATDACLNVIVTHENAPAWAASQANGPINIAPLSELTQYIGALVERYDGDGVNDAPGSPVVRYFEFYNEPDSVPEPLGNRWGHVGKKYANMLKAVYPVVKQASPAAQVVFGGVAYDWFAEEEPDGRFVRGFLDAVFTEGKFGNGPTTYFDVMNFHAYPSFWARWATRGPGLLEKTNAIRAKLAEYGLEDKPIIITETGWHNNNYFEAPSNDALHARLIAQLLTQSMAANIKVVIYWMLYDPGNFYPYESGLVTNDGNRTEKPAFKVYKNFTHLLAHAKFTRIIPASETKAANMEAYQFNDPIGKNTIYIAWIDSANTLDLQGTAIQETLRVAGQRGTVYDLYGTATPITDLADGTQDNMLRVNIGNNPLYIVVPK